MAGTLAGSGKYCLEKAMAEILELKATQKKDAKQYLDAKFSSAADKISFISDNTKPITVSPNLKIQGQQLKKVEETINQLETTLKETARQTNKNDRAIDDLEQHRRRNYLILNGCRDISKKESSYAEFKTYAVTKLNHRLGLSYRIKTFDIDTCHNAIFFLLGKNTHSSSSSNL